MHHYLDFEQEIAELDGKIHELRHMDNSEEVNLVDEIKRLEDKSEKLLDQIYAKLTPWQRVQIARHPDRPKTLEYIDYLFTDVEILSGDRAFADDQAIIGGLARFMGYSCMFIGQEKGTGTAERVRRNFGMPRPEGYRKAQRLMKMAEQFSLPLFTFVDTPGAYPGVGAEERGQAEAIARSIECCLNLKTPIIATIIGEGGSGGAIAIAVADYVNILSNSVYSVISPEGCASILWRDAAHAQTAAEAMKLTASDLKKFGVVDTIIAEPSGGAQRHKIAVMERLKKQLEVTLLSLMEEDGARLRMLRRERYLAIDGHPAS